MKHFEDVWNWVESKPISISEAIDYLSKINFSNVDDLDVGKILLYLTVISKHQHCNVYLKLVEAAQNWTIDQED